MGWKGKIQESALKPSYIFGSLDGDDDDTKDGDFMPSKAPTKKAPKRPRQSKTDKAASKKVKKEPKEPKVPKTKKSKNLSPAGGGGHASKPIWPKRVTVQEMQFVRSFVDLGEGFKEFGPGMLTRQSIQDEILF